jgi:hypothetical protein
LRKAAFSPGEMTVVSPVVQGGKASLLRGILDSPVMCSLKFR